mmetsp:Transcript_20830/g.48281  ORF Transcript_20830/g.48281 Transcript_20830/m.48281 type:complete len:223 (+) Transcript_20830:830-1498(+)
MVRPRFSSRRSDRRCCAVDRRVTRVSSWPNCCVCSRSCLLCSSSAALRRCSFSASKSPVVRTTVASIAWSFASVASCFAWISCSFSCCTFVKVCNSSSSCLMMLSASAHCCRNKAHSASSCCRDSPELLSSSSVADTCLCNSSMASCTSCSCASEAKALRWASFIAHTFSLISSANFSPPWTPSDSWSRDHVSEKASRPACVTICSPSPLGCDCSFQTSSSR